MRAPTLFALMLLVLTDCRTADGPSGTAVYRVEEDKNSIVSRMTKTPEGESVRKVTLSFRLVRKADDKVDIGVNKEDIVVEEEKKPVVELEIQAPSAGDLTIVFALDISGSMRGKIDGKDNNTKMDEARKAGHGFLDRLDDRADVGLILFDHEIQQADVIPPARKSVPQAEHRQRLRALLDRAQPRGGTAYLDATVKAVELLQGVRGRRAVVVLTDGVDVNSKQSLRQAIEAAQIAEVPVYTVGIGMPGKDDKVTTVLVLDRSGSMRGRADKNDKVTKMVALKRAAKRFVELMRAEAQTTLLPFDNLVEVPEPFTSDKKTLLARIDRLTPRGGTSLYDATFDGIQTLTASDRPGRRAVVVLTDGVDEAPGSRRGPKAVIEDAQKAGIPLYMLGLGLPHEVNRPVMEDMAKKTGGEYFHAGTEKKLLALFEDLSIKLHDDGIDEKSLKELASETGGRYTHVSKVSELKMLSERLAEELQSSYRVTYRSWRPEHDGFNRGIKIKVVRDGRTISEGGDLTEERRGLMVPQMDFAVYLLFLGALTASLTLPTAMKRLHRAFGG